MLYYLHKLNALIGIKAYTVFQRVVVWCETTNRLSYNSSLSSLLKTLMLAIEEQLGQIGFSRYRDTHWISYWLRCGEVRIDLYLSEQEWYRGSLQAFISLLRWKPFYFCPKTHSFAAKHTKGRFSYEKLHKVHKKILHASETVLKVDAKRICW